ncbi:site-specific DNA-methyltransferase [Flavobacterium haoranii]|uniref:site-specific DNA-methyltransferase (adenine-specific) n=1 Tax=Flavobacterium haoranii TaxID=683124 RepID=A0A1M6BX06_9FLAO|nr:site-specific DNA-methyltransferase [Flavobacterium haoranii]SHI53064.1 type III restriction enzyme/adenine-specific DNA-methyltransferase [Flavobacterium haoranii]
MIKNIEKSNENVAINDKEIAILKEHFPTCFKNDGSFDIERFKETLKDKVDVVHEGYELKFLGKSYAKLLASLDTTTVITPNEEHNNQPENTNSENIYISGDNLDGLKHLLKSYAKSVKCIYIDPPYNTGSDGFVYKDNFNFTTEELQDKLSVDENQANRILELTQKGSASHSAWLMFMYSRLQLAKDLLKEDGVIFISIDDNEQANLKLLCDDVFGEENFIAQIMIVANPGGRDYNQVAVTHEYLMCYSKSELSELSEIKKEAKFKFSDENGGYECRELRNRNPKYHSGNRPNLFYPFYVNPNIQDYDGYCSVSLIKDENYNIEVKPYNSTGKESVWRWGKPKSNDNIVLNDPFKSQIIAKQKKDGDWNIYEKSRKSTTKVKSIWDESGMRTEDGTRLVRQIFEETLFDHPKPIDLVKRAIEIGSEDDIILDFFSGSATTANAVLKLNSEENSSRKFISIQLPEILDLKNPSQQNAYNFLKSNNLPTTLDYLGFERIKRAAKKIKEETNAEIDYGFKHFILNEPNPNTLDKCETFDKANLIANDSILDDFGVPTVLTTWLNYDGYGLTTKATEIDLKGYTAYYHQKHLYLIHTDFTQEAVMELFEKYDTIPHFNPENIVLFGYSFNEWSVTEMLEKNLKILNDTEKNLKINIEVRY